MGNEQGKPIQDSRNAGNESIKFDYEALIVIRGIRKIGKTSMVKRMQGQSFDPNYEPTPALDAFEIPWRTQYHSKVKIKVWDVVETYLAGSSNQPLPDATTVDTLKRANGLVIIIDSRNQESIDLAVEIISEAPEDLQICVFSNFLDEADASPVIPEDLQDEIGRFYFIPGSLRTNQGLVELAKWLQLPMIHAKRKMYADLFRATDEELRSLEHDFTSTATNYTTLEEAKNHLPELIHIKKPVPSPAPAQTQKKPENTNSDDGFWSDDGNTTKSAPKPQPLITAKQTPVRQQTQQTQLPKKPQSSSDDEGFWSDDGDDDNDIRHVQTPQQREERMKPNPMVQNDPRLAAQQALIKQRMQKEIKDTKQPLRKRTKIEPEPEKEKPKPTRRKKEAFWSDEEPGYEESEPEPEPAPVQQAPVKRRRVVKKAEQTSTRPQVIPRAQVLPRQQVRPAVRETVKPVTASGLAESVNLFEDEAKPAPVLRRRRINQETKQTGGKKR